MPTVRRYARFYPTEAMKPSFLRCLAAAAAGALLLGTWGCRQASGPIVVASGVPGRASLLSGGSEARWRADFDRLGADIPRAVRNCHWALLRLRRHAAAQSPAAPPATSAAAARISASALLPNERGATIAARAEADGQITVAFRVGHRGDSGAERRFLKELAKVLRGKRARQYRGRFEWPA